MLLSKCTSQAHSRVVGNLSFSIFTPTTSVRMNLPTEFHQHLSTPEGQLEVASMQQFTVHVQTHRTSLFSNSLDLCFTPSTNLQSFMTQINRLDITFPSVTSVLLHPVPEDINNKKMRKGYHFIVKIKKRTASSSAAFRFLPIWQLLYLQTNANYIVFIRQISGLKMELLRYAFEMKPRE